MLLPRFFTFFPSSFFWFYPPFFTGLVRPPWPWRISGGEGGGVGGSERGREERKPSRWRLFCSRGSVSEHKPCAAAPISPAAPSIPHVHAHARMHTHPYLYIHILFAHTNKSPFSLVSCTVFFFIFFCTSYNVHADVSVSLTANDDAKALGAERRGAVPSHTMLLSHWISQAPVQAGWLAGRQRHTAVGMTWHSCTGREWPHTMGCRGVTVALGHQHLLHDLFFRVFVFTFCFGFSEKAQNQWWVSITCLP